MSELLLSKVGRKHGNYEYVSIHTDWLPGGTEEEFHIMSMFLSYICGESVTTDLSESIRNVVSLRVHHAKEKEEILTLVNDLKEKGYQSHMCGEFTITSTILNEYGEILHSTNYDGCRFFLGINEKDEIDELQSINKFSFLFRNTDSVPISEVDDDVPREYVKKEALKLRNHLLDVVSSKSVLYNENSGYFALAVIDCWNEGEMNEDTKEAMDIINASPVVLEVNTIDRMISIKIPLEGAYVKREREIPIPELIGDGTFQIISSGIGKAFDVSEPYAFSEIFYPCSAFQYTADLEKGECTLILRFMKMKENVFPQLFNNYFNAAIQREKESTMHGYFNHSNYKRPSELANMPFHNKNECIMKMVAKEDLGKLRTNDFNFVVRNFCKSVAISSHILLLDLEVDPEDIKMFDLSKIDGCTDIELQRGMSNIITVFRNPMLMNFRGSNGKYQAEYSIKFVSYRRLKENEQFGEVEDHYIPVTDKED